MTKISEGTKGTNGTDGAEVALQYFGPPGNLGPFSDERQRRYGAMCCSWAKIDVDREGKIEE